MFSYWPLIGQLVSSGLFSVSFTSKPALEYCFYKMSLANPIYPFLLAGFFCWDNGLFLIKRIFFLGFFKYILLYLRKSLVGTWHQGSPAIIWVRQNVRKFNWIMKSFREWCRQNVDLIFISLIASCCYFIVITKASPSCRFKPTFAIGLHLLWQVQTCTFFLLCKYR